MAPSALSVVTTTFTDPKERGKAFGVWSAIAVSGGAVGLLLGGLLTEYLSWRWCLYVNLAFAAVSGVGAALLLRTQPSPDRPRLDIPGVLAVSGGMFCIVYGFANAATHSWRRPSTWGFLAAGAALLTVFAWLETRAPTPLLPLRIVLDHNRGGAYLSILIAGSGIFGLLFLTYYMQLTLRFSPAITGVAFLPMVGCTMISANLATIVLMPRLGPKPLVPVGMLIAGGAMALLTRIRIHSGYATDVLPSLLLAGSGFGLTVAPSINTGTFGVAPHRRGRRVGQRQHRAAARRVDRHRADEHDRDDRRDQLSGEPRFPRHGSDRQSAGARVRARLHHGVLVVGRDLRFRRAGRHGPVPPGPAHPPGCSLQDRCRCQCGHAGRRAARE